MKAKNKIKAGYLKEYKFKKCYGKLYLKCLEKEYAVNKMTISSFQIINCSEQPSGLSIFTRGFILSKLFGTLGLITGAATAKKNKIYTVKLTFSNGESGLAEIDSYYYDLLVGELFDL